MRACFVIVLLLAGCAVNPSADRKMVEGSATLHAFYYSWYMNPEVDGRWFHWNHDVLSPRNTSDESTPPFPGDRDIGANFFPSLGAYSSSDPDVMTAHAKMMVDAGIDNVVLSWWGADAPEASGISRFVDVLAEHKLTFSFHIEPFYTGPENFRNVIEHLHAEFGRHPALYRLDTKPMYFLYDSHRLSPTQWRTVLENNGSYTLRDTALDGHFIGLWVQQKDGPKIVNGNFDGFYTYFAVDGFVYGSTMENWPALAAFAEQNQLAFVPCVGPGYRDDRIRPWNTVNTRKRQDGKYYDAMFERALQLQTRDIAVTSFNEWHEGTQIEPATPMQVGEYAYDDYSPLAEDYYIQRTRHWKTEMENRYE